MNTNPAACTYEAQLAKRVGELLPGLSGADRLELIGAMDPDDLRSSLAFIASMYPQAFDFALVRDAAMVGRLNNRHEDQAGDDEDTGTGQHVKITVTLDCGHILTYTDTIKEKYPFGCDECNEDKRTVKYPWVITTEITSAGEDEDEDDLEPYCRTCGERIGCFIGYEGWHHFQGEGTPENRTELYDAGHVPAVAWRATGEESQ